MVTMGRMERGGGEGVETLFNMFVDRKKQQTFISIHFLKYWKVPTSYNSNIFLGFYFV